MSGLALIYFDLGLAYVIATLMLSHALAERAQAVRLVPVRVATGSLKNPLNQ